MKCLILIILMVVLLIVCGCGIRNIEKEKFVVLMGTDGQYHSCRTEKVKFWSGYLLSIMDASSIFGRADSNEIEIGIGHLSYKTDPNSIDASGRAIATTGISAAR